MIHCSKCSLYYAITFQQGQKYKGIHSVGSYDAQDGTTRAPEARNTSTP